MQTKLVKPATITTSLEPYIKYPGSKRDFLHHLQPLFQSHLERDRPFTDLFTGSMAVPLGLCAGRRQVTCNDINPHIVNLHHHVMTGKLSLVGVPLVNTREAYLEARNKFNQLIKNKAGRSSVEAAQLLFYLLFTCFRGLVRFSLAGEFNTSYGLYKQINYRRQFEEYTAAMQGWRLTCGDFAAVELDPDAAVYADSPYDSVEPSEPIAPDAPQQLGLFDALPSPPPTKKGKGFTGYFERFDWQDQVRLAQFLACHADRPSHPPVVASNAYTDRIVTLYESLGFTVMQVQAKRSIDVAGDRTAANEMLAYRNVQA